METTTNLQLPYLMPSQAQKHVIHNEALSVLDAIIQLSVASRNLTLPPDPVADGTCYIIAEGAGGAWTGWDNALGAYIDGGWRRLQPKDGWIAFVADEACFLSYGDSQWQALSETALRDLPRLGIGMAADSVNPFAARLNKALWTARYEAEGGDGSLRYTLNKEEPAAILSLLMQSDWSGRAEIGLIGDDDLQIKVSEDGAFWKEALRIDRQSGVASFPQTPALAALANLTGTNGSFIRFTGADAAAMQAIVGVVAQEGGVATGAIIEGGTNANGTYVRYADGAQFCINAVNASASEDVTWVYPARFSTTPLYRNGGIGTGNPVVRSLTTSSVNATSLNLRVVDKNDTRVAATASMLAFGRWF